MILSGRQYYIACIYLSSHIIFVLFYILCYDEKNQKDRFLGFIVLYFLFHIILDYITTW